MKTIRKSDIPPYLRNSSLYRSLVDEDGIFQVHDFKENDQVSNFQDFKKVLKSVVYFDAQIPNSLDLFYIKNSKEVSFWLLKKNTLESKEKLVHFYKIHIENDDQFISNYIISKNLKLFLNENFIEYGSDNRDRFLRKFQNFYGGLIDSDTKSDENDYSENKYIKLLYEELLQYVDFRFETDFSLFSRDDEIKTVMKINFVLNETVDFKTIEISIIFSSMDKVKERFKELRDLSLSEGKNRDLWKSELGIYYHKHILIFLEGDYPSEDTDEDEAFRIPVTIFNRKKIYDSFDQIYQILLTRH